MGKERDREGRREKGRGWERREKEREGEGRRKMGEEKGPRTNVLAMIRDKALSMRATCCVVAVFYITCWKPVVHRDEKRPR
eukprot:9340677-Pyramimonas_sp.AAC.1